MVIRLYSVRILIEKPFVPAGLVEAPEKRGKNRRACIRSRLGRKVRSDVRGLIPTVIRDKRTLSHNLGGARSAESDLTDRDGVAERQIAR
jgi:hypothetical protein